MISLPFRSRRRGVSARIGSLVMIFQRMPLLKLLPEARVISTSGFSEAITWTVTGIAGLGAFDSVSGASIIRQVQPFPDSPTVDAVAGEPLRFVWQAVGLPHTPASFSLAGEVPSGLVQTGLLNSTVDSLTGTPAQAGNYVMRVIAWEFPDQGGDTFEETFTFNISNPPFPAITAQPAGGNFHPNAFVSMVAGQTSGQRFTWKLNDSALPAGETVLFARAAPRMFRMAPDTDPGAAWRSGEAFDETSLPAWTHLSGGIGYDTNPSPVSFLPHIASEGNTQSAMLGTGKPVSVHLRMPFTISNPAAFSFLKLRVQSDDGFVAWINGTEVASQNRPAILEWNSPSNGAASDSTAVTFREIDIPQHLGVLRAGNNLLAVQAMNEGDFSPDFLFNCELAAGINAINSPRLVLTSLQPSDTGTYTFTVSNAAGSVTSDPAPVLILPDTYATWQIAQFPPEAAVNPDISGPSADPDGDAISNEREYIFGTVPLTPESAPLPEATATGNTFEVRFTARRAAGAGYEGRVRHYTVETTRDLSAATWTTIPLVSDITGNDQSVVCIMPIGPDRTFCRLRIWLTP